MCNVTPRENIIRLRSETMSFFLSKKSLHSVFQFFKILHFALPHDQNRPSSVFQKRHGLLIPPNIIIELCIPEFLVGRRSCAAWTVVLMPETAMNEDDLFPAREYQIGSSRKILTMKTISESHSMNHTANQHLGFRIPSSYTPHEATAKIGGYMIHHCMATDRTLQSKTFITPEHPSTSPSPAALPESPSILVG